MSDSTFSRVAALCIKPVCKKRSYKHFHAFMQSQKINKDTYVSSITEAEMHENIPDALK